MIANKCYRVPNMEIKKNIFVIFSHVPPSIPAILDIIELMY